MRAKGDLDRVLEVKAARGVRLWLFGEEGPMHLPTDSRRHLLRNGSETFV